MQMSSMPQLQRQFVFNYGSITGKADILWMLDISVLKPEFKTGWGQLQVSLTQAL